MRKLIIAGLAALALSGTARADNISNKDLSQWCTSGQKAAGMNDSYCRGYLAGIVDILGGEEVICTQFNHGQLAAGYGEFLSASPELADKPAALSYQIYLTKLYACKTPKNGW